MKDHKQNMSTDSIMSGTSFRVKSTPWTSLAKWLSVRL